MFYTRSRAEKKTLEQLTRHGQQTYLPLIEEVKQWSDRKKKVEVPLFRSYIFIHCAEHEIPELLQWQPNLVTYVRYNGKPAVIRQEELDSIERFISTGLSITVQNDSELEQGDRVKVMGGPLEGMEGEITEMANQHFFMVHIEAIQQAMMVKVPEQFLKKI